MQFRRLGVSEIAAIAERTTSLAKSRFALQRSASSSPHEWAAAFEENLLSGILPFWLEHAVDRERGGMFCWLDRQGRPTAPGTKSLVVQARVVWLFSAAYQRYGCPAYRDVADHALKFMREYLRDDEYGGYYWMSDRNGRIVADKKHVYGQCFAIFGLAEFSRAFNDEAARQEALELFHLVDRQTHDDIHGGYHQAFSANWEQLLEDDATFGYNQTGGKHQCAHTSLLEAFNTLYSVTGDARVRDRLSELLDISISNLVDPTHGHSYIQLAADWSPILSDRASYGHDIKLSWLLTTTARALGRDQEMKVQQTVLSLVDHSLRDGFDSRIGGVFWEGPAQGPADEKQKVWWVQAETLMGLLNAYEISGEHRYWTCFEQQARYVLACTVDDKYGEWFEYGEPVRQALHGKTRSWKEPYHQGRACLEISRRLRSEDGADANQPAATGAKNL